MLGSHKGCLSTWGHGGLWDTARLHSGNRRCTAPPGRMAFILGGTRGVRTWYVPRIIEPVTHTILKLQIVRRSRSQHDELATLLGISLVMERCKQAVLSLADTSVSAVLTTVYVQYLAWRRPSSGGAQRMAELHANKSPVTIVPLPLQTLHLLSCSILSAV